MTRGQTSSGSRGRVRVTLAAGLVLALCGSTISYAVPQPPSRQPTKTVRRGKTVRQPVIDLEKQAMERRPGQVLPGDPPPEKFAAPLADPAAAKPGQAPPMPVATELPSEGKDGTTGQPLKAAPVPVDPAAGPRPASKPVAKPAPAEPPKAAEPEPANEPAIDLPKAAADELQMLKDPTERAANSSGTAADALYSWQPTNVVVTGITGDAGGFQWRQADQPDAPWQSAGPGWTSDGRFQIRTGLGTEVTVLVGGSVEVKVRRLSRVTIEQAAALGSAPSQVPSVRVDHGSVELMPVESGASAATLVRSPDRADGFASSAGEKVTYNAFKGTRVESLRLTRAAE